MWLVAGKISVRLDSMRDGSWVDHWLLVVSLLPGKRFFVLPISVAWRDVDFLAGGDA